MKGQIRFSTAALLALVALLTGGLVMSYTHHDAPVFVSTAHAAGYEQGPLVSFAPVVKHVMPAVVNISSTKVVKNHQSQMPGMMQDPLFRQFFGERFQTPQEPRERRAESLGSGVVVSPEGYILTNNHVVEGASQVKVSFADKREVPAKVVGTDPLTDIAVLKIDDRNAAVVALSDSSRAQVGDVVLAVGNPFGLHQTVTMGIISAMGRSGLGIERFEDFIQTDAPINPGNSGGALINTRGELVGINTAIYSGNSGGNQGIGFAIPVNLAKNVMEQIIKTGKAQHGYVGIVLDPNDMSAERAKAFGLPTGTKGVAIAEVEPSSPGGKAGLQAGDVITSLNGQPVDDMQAFRGRVAAMSPNTVANLKVFRNGKEMPVPVTLGSASDKNLGGDADQDDNSVPDGGGMKGALPGVAVQGLTSDMRQQLRIPEGTQGVIVTNVDADSAAAQAGLEQGDIIVQANRKKVTSVDQFSAAVRQGDGSGATLLLVRRSGGSQFLVIPNSK